jgi:hypothetical protein
MKKVAKRTPAKDDMRPEYRFDYSKARPNRFASRFQPGSLPVVLDPDVAEVFARRSMKKVESQVADDDMRPEYDFSGAVRGKYFERYKAFLEDGPYDAAILVAARKAKAFRQDRAAIEMLRREGLAA